MGEPPILDEASLPAYLAGLGIVAPGARLAVEPAGDGNINWVRRVRAPGGRSWIVKQARPALERFPEYRVSTERIVFEARYLETARAWDEEGVLPGVHRFDPEARVLVLEDLSGAPRLDHVLAGGGDATGAAARIGRFLGRVHGASSGRGDLAARFANHEMRRLHGDHIFALPFAPNDFPLPGRVRAAAEAIWRDPELPEIAARAYQRYLRDEGALVHADVQAGNVLLAPDGARLLDAEIAHVGDPAFDVGTLLAHLLLPALARGRPWDARTAVESAWEAYREGRGHGGDPGFENAARYAAIECLRRTVGAARVAVVGPEDAALAVVERAVAWMRSPPVSPGSLTA